MLNQDACLLFVTWFSTEMSSQSREQYKQQKTAFKKKNSVRSIVLTVMRIIITGYYPAKFTFKYH